MYRIIRSQGKKTYYYVETEEKTGALLWSADSRRAAMWICGDEATEVWQLELRCRGFIEVVDNLNEEFIRDAILAIQGI